MKSGFAKASMRRRKIDYRKDDRCETGEEAGKNLNMNRIGAVPDDHGGPFRMGIGEKNLIEVVPGKKFVYGIKKTRKRRWGNEPGKVL